MSAGSPTDNPAELPIFDCHFRKGLLTRSTRVRAAHCCAMLLKEAPSYTVWGWETGVVRFRRCSLVKIGRSRKPPSTFDVSTPVTCYAILPGCAGAPAGGS